MDNKTTLFTYKPGESVESFANASFVPMFVEDLKFANDSLRQQAEEACQGDVNCLFDSASTKDVSLGESTKAVSVTLEKESSSLSMHFFSARCFMYDISFLLFYQKKLGRLICRWQTSGQKCQHFVL